MFSRILSAFAGGGICWYAVNGYKNYLVLNEKTIELADKITRTYHDLIAKNSKFEESKKKSTGMEWVMTATPKFPGDLLDFENAFGRPYYAVVHDVKQSEAIQSECVVTMRRLTAEKMEYNLNDDQLRKSIYAYIKAIFYETDPSDWIKKIEALSLNEIDQKGLMCDLGHWNTRLELDWLLRTNEQELSSDLVSSNGTYLLNHVDSLEDLSQRLNRDKSIAKKDLKNSLLLLNNKLKNYVALIGKVKYMEKSIKSESDVSLSKELEEIIKDFKRMDDKLYDNAKALHDKSLKNLEETQMLEAWEERTVISPTRWADKFEKTKMGRAEIHVQQSLSVAHSTILCVLSTQAVQAERKKRKNLHD